MQDNRVNGIKEAATVNANMMTYTHRGRDGDSVKKRAILESILK